MEQQIERQIENPFAQLQISTEQKQQLKDLDKRQMEVEQSEREAISEYEQSLTKALEGKQEQVKTSKLEQSIEKNKMLGTDLTKIVQSIVYELGDYGQLIVDMKQRTNFEKYFLCNLGLTKMADTRMRERAEKQTIEEKLKTVLDYACFMKEKVYGFILKNKKCQLELQGSHAVTLKKLNDNQPNYEYWRDQNESVKRKLKDVDDKLDIANETERPALQTQKTDLERKLQEADFNEKHYFVIVKTSRESIEHQRRFIKAYSDTLGALDVIRTLLDNKVQDVTKEYEHAPVVIQTALAMKGASEVDRAVNATTDKIHEAVLTSVAGMLDESAGRVEKEQIGHEKSLTYRKYQENMYNNYLQRFEALMKNHAKPEGDNQ